jgi:hypothetical protein
MAGEGIEYAWACGKYVYCRLPLKDKKTKAKFCESVSKCLDADKVLTMLSGSECSASELESVHGGI